MGYHNNSETLSALKDALRKIENARILGMLTPLSNASSTLYFVLLATGKDPSLVGLCHDLHVGVASVR